MPTHAGAKGASQAHNHNQYEQTKKNAQKNKTRNAGAAKNKGEHPAAGKREATKTLNAKKGGSRRTRKNRRMRKC